MRRRSPVCEAQRNGGREGGRDDLAADPVGADEGAERKPVRGGRLDHGDDTGIGEGPVIVRLSWLFV